MNIVIPRKVSQNKHVNVKRRIMLGVCFNLKFVIIEMLNVVHPTNEIIKSQS